ncbi:hypothetical protein [Dyella sp. C11]|uniref:hypothetical protein n=1 Tax=Dyella sp. C11 TaxID=2126991 RepID=UPI000D65EA85|nr:hypothetical protein [Dyella sp. C11]
MVLPLHNDAADDDPAGCMVIQPGRVPDALPQLFSQHMWLLVRRRDRVLYGRRGRLGIGERRAFPRGL